MGRTGRNLEHGSVAVTYTIDNQSQRHKNGTMSLVPRTLQCTQVPKMRQVKSRCARVNCTSDSPCKSRLQVQLACTARSRRIISIYKYGVLRCAAGKLKLPISRYTHAHIDTSRRACARARARARIEFSNSPRCARNARAHFRTALIKSHCEMHRRGLYQKDTLTSIRIQRTSLSIFCYCSVSPNGRMSGSVHVTVSPDSQIIVFSGNLLKAPPLSRKGRKVTLCQTPHICTHR